MVIRFHHCVTNEFSPLLVVALKCVTPPADDTLLVPPCRDTAGQERFQTITKQYYRRAQVTKAHRGKLVLHCSVLSLMVLLVQGIIFVYDITSGPSFQHLAKWVSDVDEVRAPTLSGLMVTGFQLQTNVDVRYRSDIGLISV